MELEERKKELAQIASGKTIDQGENQGKNQGKGKKEKGKSGDNVNSDAMGGDSVGGQAIAFAESLLEQAAAIKAQLPMPERS